MSIQTVAVNTRFLLKDQLEGIGWFTAETLKRITRNHPEVTFHFIFDRPYDDEFIYAENVIPHVIGPQARHPILWYWWFEHALPKLLKKIQPDVFLSTDGFLSLSTKIPSATVIHDIAFEHFPQMVGKSARWYYKHFTPKYAKHAKQLATVSNFSKEDIVAHYNVPADKIAVVYNGAKSVYQPISDTVKEEVRSEVSDGQPFFIYAGSVHPRKNVANLLRAFDQFKENTGATHKQIIAGRRAWMCGDVEDVLNGMKFKEDVIFLDHLSAGELARVMASSTALTYVSVFEGFGIPILEAFHCEVPVITSNTSSMKEVAGEAAMLVDPLQPDSIAAAMDQIVSSNQLCDDLVEKGKKRRTDFGWDKTAAKLWNVIESV